MPQRVQPSEGWMNRRKSAIQIKWIRMDWVPVLVHTTPCLNVAAIA